MATFTVHQGKRYRATISLGLLERLASNDAIADRLKAAGFTEISVTGSGRTRVAEALWPRADAMAEMPKQIVEVREV
jgi:transketolase N-terminal domain/subunit